MKRVVVPLQSCRHLVVIVGEMSLFIKFYMSEILLQDTMLS